MPNNIESLDAALLPEFPRPEYPSAPEILLSDLAWAIIKRKEGDTSDLALIYSREARKVPKRVRIARTNPMLPPGETSEATSTNELDTRQLWIAALESGGLRGVSAIDPRRIAEAVAQSLRGTLPKKGVGYCSSSIGVAGALLQDASGGLAKQGPPDFARIFNTAYLLGGEGEWKTGASRGWFSAACRYAARSELNVIERSLVSSSLHRFIDPPAQWPPDESFLSERSRGSAGRIPIWWAAEQDKSALNTFGWFRRSWDRLCSEQWTSCLGERRWAAWAACVLRHGLAFTYLWEANFFTQLLLGLASPHLDAREVARNALVPPRPLVPWFLGTATESDVWPAIKQTLSLGDAARRAILSLPAPNVPPGEEGLGALITELRKLLAANGEAAEQIRTTARSEGAPPRLTAEAVRYALLCRTGSSDNESDDFGLLRIAGRNKVQVDPAPEWIVAMSALSVNDPSKGVFLGDVLKAVRSLGLRPRIDHLAAILERAGLCAGAADGDEGIEIDLGFGTMSR